MLKLRFLFDNANLSQMLLENWEHDSFAEGDFRFVRTSANAVCSFQWNKQMRYLRYCPVAEKSPQSVAAELDFIGYLALRGYRAPEIVASKSGESLLCRDTPWGSYVASAFRAMPGRAIKDLGPFEPQMVSSLGQSLGRLHRLSSEYSTDGERRRNHLQVLESISQTLAEVGRQDRACAEAAALRAFFSRLPAGGKVYGLVHYDFETDNVFLDESTSTLGVIDFDDAMYHWYVMDIEQTLDSLAEHIEKKDSSAWKDAFLAGYRLEFGIDGDLIQMLPGFRRFADLYTYTRVLRSIQEKWENEPQWMQGLRRKLGAVLEARSAKFGLPLPE